MMERKKEEEAAANLQSKSTDRTVFVRLVPPSANVRRHHLLESVFSEIGPIKKCSVIVKNDDTVVSASYGFVKYTTQEDAERAAKQCDGKKLELSATETVRLRVELASTAAASAATDKKRKRLDKETNRKKAKEEAPQSPASAVASLKKNCRVIVRNLAFRAKEQEIRQVLETKFGPLTEVHIPTVTMQPPEQPLQGKQKKLRPQQPRVVHRGFCFCTFAHAKDAKACVEFKAPIRILDRPVEISLSLNKTEHEREKKKAAKRPEKPKVEETPQERDDADGSSSSSTSASSNSDDDDDGSASDDEDKEEPAKKQKQQTNKASSTDPSSKQAMAEQRVLFCRNLAFDVTRHDLFDVLKQYGRIDSIHLCKSQETGLLKGTAFIQFTKPGGARRALQAARVNDAAAAKANALSSPAAVAASSAVTAAAASGGEEAKPVAPNPAAAAVSTTGVMVKGRRLWMDYAVDKDTASAFLTHNEETANNSTSGKDRRNLYLRTEGVIEMVPRAQDPKSTSAWAKLNQADQDKRSSAWRDKITKLKSPLFFVNPTRLSIRNLSKHVDPKSLKDLIVKATKMGMERNLVSIGDQVAQWKAQGNITTRELLHRVQLYEKEKEDERKRVEQGLPPLESKLPPDQQLFPKFDEKNVRQHIPSVYLDWDFERNRSRGFAFCEFQHHLHALACLRQLNNNTLYSRDYAYGYNPAVHERRRKVKPKKKFLLGGGIDDGMPKPPRLMVEFAVENRYKAREQARHRAQTQANRIKQKLEHAEKGEAKKQSRGARQRERKRQAKLNGEEEEDEPAAEQQKTKEATRDAEARNKSREDEDRLTTATKRSYAIVMEPVKPVLSKRKRRKLRWQEENEEEEDPEEAKFSKLVESYKRSFGGGSEDEEGTDKPAADADKPSGQKKSGKRWFQ